MADETDPVLTSANGSIDGPSDSCPYTAPLSYQQKCFWDLSQKHPGACLDISIALRLSGKLHEEILRRCFEHVVDRHSALRTRITVLDGGPCQMIDPPDRYRLDIKSIAPQPGVEIERLREMVDDFFNMSFHLLGGDLFRAQLIVLSKNDHVMLVKIHHIIIDGFSVGILFDELWHCYGAMSRRRLPDLPKVHMQYSDYARWQRQTRQSWLANNAKYWKARLANVEPLKIPIDQSSSDHGAGCPDKNLSLLTFDFDERLSAGIYVAARCHGTPPALIVLSAYVALLSWWCNQNEFLIPMHVSGRDEPENINTIGVFADVLLLRMEVTGKERFEILVDKVIQEVCAAYEHRSHWRLFSETDIPHVEKSGRTCFNWTPRSSDELAGCPSQGILQQLEGEISVERFPCEIPHRFPEIDESSQFAVGFIWMHPGRVITGTLGYNTSILSKDRAEMLVETLKVAIERFSEAPEQQISFGLSEFGKIKTR